jgi:SAM-dependent methyltransferase
MMKLESQKLTRAFPNFKTLIEDSHVTGGDPQGLLEHWIENRQPIVRAIKKPGTLLDIGCANGFLLTCLQFWSEHQITPYGIDIDKISILAARALLPEYANHFATLYWNVWDGLDFVDPLYKRYAENAFAAVRDGGRVILGFYDTNHDAIRRQLEWLVGRFGAYRQKLTLDVIFAWWDCELLA